MTVIFYMIIMPICGVLIYAFLWVATGTIITLIYEHAFEILPEKTRARPEAGHFDPTES